MPGSNKVWFATSNPHKFEEARLALRPFRLVLRRLPDKGTEVQSDDLEEIARRAALEVYGRAKRPLFVEDTGLFVRALNGFPGPYAAYVDRTVGPGSLLALLQGRTSREAEFVSVIALCQSPSDVELFTGKLKGTVSTAARGAGGFGFDPVFVPRGGTRTLSEMTLAQKVAISHRSAALKALGARLESRFSG
jgi:XTP/dITP diphosphohydrolase